MNNYVAFCDISKGVGASNSTLCVKDVRNRETILAYANPSLAPEDFARMAVAIVRWVGGQQACLTGWELNGPGDVTDYASGVNFGAEVHRLGYYAVFGNVNTLLPWEPQDSKVGWRSTRERKALLLGDFRAALARGETIEHEAAMLDEAADYVYLPSGAIGPATLGEDMDGDDAMASHGDRTIAACGALMVCNHQPKPRDVPINPAKGSTQEALNNYRQAKRRMMSGED